MTRIERRLIVAGGCDYDREASLALRAELIELRDEALRQNDFEWSVKLSHVIAWMAVIIDKEWPE